MPRNNSRLILVNPLVPVCDYVEYDKSQNIWRGRLMQDTDIALKMDFDEVFFCREYNKENEFDKILQEFFFKADDDVAGIPFILVPKQKILFAFKPSSTIAMPPMRIRQPGRRQ